MGFKDRAYYRDENDGIPPVVFSFPKLSPLTVGLIGSCTAVFLIQAFFRSAGSVIESWGKLTFHNGVALTQPWRWITYQYIHAGATHLFFNMLGLFFFLPALELLWGWRKTLAFYTAGGIFAGLTFGLMLLFFPNSGQMSLIGSSGSIFAVLGAVALLSPQRQLILLVFPVPIRMAVALFAVLFLLTTIGDHNFSDAAHLGGLAFGFFSPLLAGPLLSKQRRKWHAASVRRAAEADQREQETVDRILQKVHDHGMNSLSRSERKALALATEHQRHRESTHRSRRT